MRKHRENPIIYSTDNPLTRKSGKKTERQYADPKIKKTTAHIRTELILIITYVPEREATIREKKIFIDLFGLEDGRVKSKKEVAEKYGENSVKIDNIKNKMLRILKRNEKAKDLWKKSITEQSE